MYYLLSQVTTTQKTVLPPPTFVLLTISNAGLFKLNYCARSALSTYKNLSNFTIDGFNGLQIALTETFGIKIALLFDSEHEHCLGYPLGASQTWERLNCTTTDLYPGQYDAPCTNVTLLFNDHDFDLAFTCLGAAFSFANPIPLPLP